MDLSIIVPAYNVEKYIDITLNSLINQTNMEFEVIIVNDGSTDNTLMIAEKIIKTSKISDYKIINKKNGGVSSARNRGLLESCGKYVLFLDGDDYISIDLVDNIIKNIKNKNSDILFWGFNIVSENKDVIINYFDKYKYKYKIQSGIEAVKNTIVNNSMYIWTGSAVYNRRFLIENGLKYTEQCTNGEDQEFTYKALIKAKEVVFIDEILSYYVIRDGSISNSYNIRKFDAIDALKRVNEYINNINNSELNIISDAISSEFIIKEFMFNYHSCLCNISKNNNYKQIIRNDLFYELEQNYPGLNKEIRTIIINYYNKNREEMPFRIKVFLASSKIYNWGFILKDKLNKIKNTKI